MNITIRPESRVDHADIFELNVAAFEGEGEASLVNGLRDGDFCVLSLVAVLDGKIVGHILFSRLEIETLKGTVSALSLAPMAVLPDRQRQGIGTGLIEQSLKVLRHQGERIVVVLGHPEFYTRFGFSSELAIPLRSPFSGPAWMALELVPGALAGIEGRVCYAPPFGIEPVR